MNELVPIVFISDDNFIMPTCVAITSLELNKKAATRYLVHVVMAECSDKSKQKLSELKKEGISIKLINASMDKYKDFKQISHVSTACLLKFDLCELIPEYDKIIYLDGDIIVRRDLSELYNIDLYNHYAAGVMEVNNIVKPTGNINAGVLLYNLKKIRDEKLNLKMFSLRKELGDRGSMDQQTFNMVTNKDYVYLDIKYNCVPGYVTLFGKKDFHKINLLYKSNYKNIEEIIEKACIIHFASGEKPWEYTFKSWSKEWYSFYLQSPYKDVPIQFKGTWEYRKDKYKIILSENGMAGVAKELASGIKRRIGFKRKIELEDWE